MAITLQCPRCTHEQTIDDNLAKGEVTCKICHHPIAPSALTKKAIPKPAAKKKVDASASEGLQAGMPPVQANKPPALPKSKPPELKDDDEDKASKRRAPRRRSAHRASDPTMPMLLAGGVFLLFAILCGGGVGAYFMLEGENRPPRPIAENPIPPINPVPVPNPVPIPNPAIEFPVPNPVPFPNPPIPFPEPIRNPMPPPIDPNNAADLDRALEALKGPIQQRGPAIAWLNTADTNHPRRAEIAKHLDSLVEEALNQQFGSEAFFNAYFKWATKDSVPALIRIAENARFTPWDNRHRQEAMRMLGKLKTAAAAPVIAKRVADHFDRNVATEALIEIGPGAEKAVLTAMNHPDSGARDAILRVLQTYKTSSEKMVVQCIADLGSKEANRRNASLQWLVKNPDEAKRKKELSQALNKLMAPDNCLANRELVAALETLGTSANTPRLLELLDKAPPPFGNREAMRVLGKIRDPQSVKGIAKHLATPGFVGMDARSTLKGFGTIAEPAVIELLNTTTDAKSRSECVRFLGEFGTKAISGPALVAIAARYPQDRLLGLNVRSAVTMINNRGN